MSKIYLMLNNKFFKEVICVKLDDGSYKLIIPCNSELKPNEVVSAIVSEDDDSLDAWLKYFLGIWGGLAEHSSPILKEIELIVPPSLEYAELDEHLGAVLKNQLGIDVIIRNGARIKLAKIKRRGIGNYFKGIIQQLFLKRGDIQNN